MGGCSTHVAQMDSHNKPLVDAAYFYVLIPADGYYDGRRQVGSGKLVASQIDAALETHVHNGLIGEREENSEAALTSAQHHQARYLVYASILD